MTILPRGVGFPTEKLRFESLVMGFGPVSVAFRPAEAGVRFIIEETHEPFLLEASTDADLNLDCRVGPLLVPHGSATFTAGPAWDLWRAQDGSEELVIRGGAAFETPVWHLKTDPDFRRGDLAEAPVVSSSAVRADGYPLLEYMVVRLLGRRGGLLIHASTAIVNGAAYVFVGHSGAGKSTMASLAEAQGAFIPTDDRTILGMNGDVLTAWGTPWHGSLIRKSPRGAPVRRIFLLRQSSRDRVEGMSRARAAKELFARLIQPRLHAGELSENLRFLELVVGRTDVSILHFRASPAAFAMALES